MYIYIYTYPSFQIAICFFFTFYCIDATDIDINVIDKKFSTYAGSKIILHQIIYFNYM